MSTVTLQPTLENDLVLLRSLREDDFDSLYNAANDPLIWEQHTAKRYKPKIFFDFFKESLESRGALVIIDKVTGEMIGSSRYKLVDGVESAIEIGWTFLSREFWGGHYNRSIKKLMIDHAFQLFDEVVLYIDRENYRSQKAAEKIGAVLSTGSAADLAKRSERNLTFLIEKTNWKKKWG